MLMPVVEFIVVKRTVQPLYKPCCGRFTKSVASVNVTLTPVLNTSGNIAYNPTNFWSDEVTDGIGSQSEGRVQPPEEEEEAGRAV